MTKYETYIPSDILKPFISSLAISEEENENTYVVLPGTGLVIAFQHTGSLHYLGEGKENQLAISGITGMHDKFRIFKHDGSIGSVLVYLNRAVQLFFSNIPCTKYSVKVFRWITS